MALKGFREIAADSASSWHVLAPYLVARTLVRQGTLEPGPGEVDKVALEQAQTEVKGILSNASLGGHGRSRRSLLLSGRIV